MKNEQKIRLNYQSLLETVEDLIFTLNIQGHFTYVNKRLTVYTGKSKKWWLNRHFREVLHHEDVDASLRNIKGILRGEVKTFEVRFVRHDGAALYFSANMNPIYNCNEITGIVGIARDINERMKLQQELTELKNFNESILQSMQSGLITLDLDGCITYFNSGAEEALEYPAKDVISRPLQDIIGSDTMEIILNSMTSSTPPNREVTVVTKSGKQVSIGFTVTSRLDNEGRHVGTMISFRDISQIKRMQAEVLRMDRLASLGVLASGIAHEIKNPLAGIKTMAQTLEEDFSAEDQRKVYLERIVRQVNRLDELLKAFFDYARPRTPQKKYHKIQDIVREVFTLVDQKLFEKKILWQDHYDPTTPPIFVDFHQIQQVLLNLILNAIDAMSNGGLLRISAAPDYSTSMTDKNTGVGSVDPDFVELLVLDTGQGIARGDLENIFDPFFTTKPQGTGLGLSIVFRIVTAHKGKISVESKKETGTTFRLLLPTKEFDE
jgi:PAS domain S-box-containing protein